MASRGSFNAITPEQMNRLLAIREDANLEDEECDAAILDEISQIEGTINYRSPYCLDVDKAWDAIHRCLTGDQTPDGMVNADAGRGPLKLCVLGGEQLVEADHHTVALVRPDQVSKAAAALAKIDKAVLRKRFFRLDPEIVCDYPIDDEQFEYTWSNFFALPGFYLRTAIQDRAVVFVADH